MKIENSNYFTVEEFVCRCGKCELSKPENIIKYIDPLMIEKLEQNRIALGVPIFVTSGARCRDHHINIYKSRYGDQWEYFINWDSFHLINEETGMFHACDTVPKNLDLFYCFGVYAYFRFNCVGLYSYEVSRNINQDLFLHSDTGHRNSNKSLIFYQKVYKK